MKYDCFEWSAFHKTKVLVTGTVRSSVCQKRRVWNHRIEKIKTKTIKTWHIFSANST